MARGGRQRARTALIGSALTLLTLAGHAAGSGTLPDVLGLALVSLVAVALAAAIAQRPHRPAVLVAALLGGQALLHVLLTFASGHAHATAAAPSGGAMILGHVLAAAVAAVLIGRADDVLARWGAFLAAVLGHHTPARVAPPRLRARGIAPRSADRPRSRVLLHQVVRRGPPVLGLPT